jgi:hypothetical protein
MRTSTLKISLIIFSPKFFETLRGSLKNEKYLKKKKQGDSLKLSNPTNLKVILDKAPMKSSIHFGQEL